jgi:hypothetical protein
MFAGEAARKLPSSIGILEARAGADDLKPTLWDTEAFAQAAKKQANLGSNCAAVEVGFIDHEEEALIWMRLKPRPRRVEDWTLEGAHEHVLEHRVVCDEEIWRCVEYFMAC